MDLRFSGVSPCSRSHRTIWNTTRSFSLSQVLNMTRSSGATKSTVCSTSDHKHHKKKVFDLNIICSAAHSNHTLMKKNAKAVGAWRRRKWWPTVDHPLTLDHFNVDQLLQHTELWCSYMSKSLLQSSSIHPSIPHSRPHQLHGPEPEVSLAECPPGPWEPEPWCWKSSACVQLLLLLSWRPVNIHTHTQSLVINCPTFFSL